MTTGIGEPRACVAADPMRTLNRADLPIIRSRLRAFSRRFSCTVIAISRITTYSIHTVQWLEWCTVHGMCSESGAL